MWTNTNTDTNTNTYTNTNTTVTMKGGWTWLTDKLTKDIREWCGLLHFTLLTTPQLKSWGHNSGILSNAGTSLFIGPPVQIHIDSSCFLGALEEREAKKG